MGPPVPRPPFARARVVGGGATALSLALALRARAAAGEVEIVAADPAFLETARAAGLPAAPRDSLLPGFPDAVFLTGPPSVVEAEAVERSRTGGVLLIALSAVMRPLLAIAESARENRPDLLFIGAHAILDAEDDAGGQPVGRPDLFLGRTVALCPLADAPRAALASAEHLWRLVGAVPVTLPADEHDRAAALTSHLPLVAACALAAMASELVSPGTRADLLVDADFLRATRPAAGSPELWSEILARNADHLAPLARALSGSLAETAAALERGADHPPASVQQAIRLRLAPAVAFRRRLESA